MKRNRLMLAQLALFVVISIACTWSVASDVLGPRMFRQPDLVTVRMPDSGGINPDSQVTYRGVKIGSVADSRIAPDGGVNLTLSLDPGARIPASARAVVSMDTPLALQHLDLQPDSESGPYLHNGSVIEAAQTARPLPLETLLTDFNKLGDTVNPQDMAKLSDALATGLNGTGPELTRILDNTATIMSSLREHRPQIQRVMDNARSLAGPDGSQGDRFRELAANLRSLTDQARTQEPAIRSILDTAPETTQQVARLMADSEPAVTTLLGNLVTTAQIVSVRTPALQHGITVFPGALSGLGSIVHGDTADFDLVATQGPVCTTPTDRRPPTATEPRQPGLDWHCPGDQTGLGQRGAANTPRPMGTYDPATGETGAGFQLGTSGGQSSVLGPNSWYSIPLQGIR